MRSIDNQVMRCRLSRALLSFIVLVVLCVPQRAVSESLFTEFSLDGENFPLNVTTGPDGNLWFTQAKDSIVRITPLGNTEVFTVTEGSVPYDITTGPDGNIWFTLYGGNKIGWLKPTSGSRPEYFEVRTPNSYPHGITTGPDGNIWFTLYGGNKIGRITPTGQIQESFPIPTLNTVPYDITTGPDGNLWFTEKNTNQIGRITPSGGITEFRVPATDTDLLNITVGLDNNLWITDGDGNRIWRYALNGDFTQFVVPTPGGFPKGITTGTDGNIWFTEVFGNKIGRITPTGDIEEFEIPYEDSQPQGITHDLEGNVWFTRYRATFTDVLDGGVSFTSYISRLTPYSFIISYEESRLENQNFLEPMITDLEGALWFVIDGNPDSIGKFTPQERLKEIGVPTRGSVIEILADSKGSIWYRKVKHWSSSDTDINSIGMISPGSVRPVEWMVGGPPVDFVIGPDGNLWYIIASDESQTGGIGRITSAGAEPFILPETDAWSSDDTMTVDQEGNLWLTQTSSNRIWKIMFGDATSQPQPSSVSIPSNCGNSPQNITADREGNIWFALNGRSKIGRIAPDGSLQPPIDIEVRSNLTVGPDNSIWFVGSEDNIVKLTTNSTEFYPVPFDRIVSLVAGANNELWFFIERSYSYAINDQIGRITTDGHITLFGTPLGLSVRNIAVGPDGTLWFLTRGRRIGRLPSPNSLESLFLPIITTNR